MLQPSFIKENKEAVIQALKKRNFNATDILEEIILLDQRRKEIQAESDNLQASVNKSSKEIGGLFKKGQQDMAASLQEDVKNWKVQLESLKAEADDVKTKLDDALFSVPNLPHDSLPAGSSEEDNEVYQSWDKPFPVLPEGCLPHWELMEKYDIVSLKLGVKLTGAGFPVYIGKGAKLQRALIAFF